MFLGARLCSQRLELDLPIIRMVAAIINGEVAARDAAMRLMSLPAAAETHGAILGATPAILGVG